MTTIMRRETRPNAIAGVIAALGTEQFETQTLRFLHDRSGVEHYSVYRLRDGEARFLGGASIRGRHALNGDVSARRWPRRSFVELHAADELARSANETVILHDEIRRIDDPALHAALAHHHIVDRVMLCGRPADDLYALAVLRSRDAGQFDESELNELADSADLLIAACARQAALHWDRERAISQFASVDIIEENLRDSGWGLSKRERQVGARILHGISAYGIALDLGLGEETIATYRKRLYARIRIGCRHELLQRYLALL